MWYDLGINLLSGAIELGIIYLIIDRMLNRREYDRWKPARQIILKKLNISYNTLFAAARHSFKKDPSDSSIKENLFMMQNAKHHRDKLEQTIDLNSPALESTLLSITSTYLDTSEILLNKMFYFVGIYDPQFQEYDFVFPPPFEEMKKIEEEINKANSEYSDLVEDHIATEKNQIEEIIPLWEELKNSSDRLFFNPESYEYREDRKPYSYDISILNKIGSDKENKPGQGIKVFKNY